MTQRALKNAFIKNGEDNGYFHAEVDRKEETIHDCDASTKHYRTASHGTRIRQYHAGYFDPLQENAGLQCIMATWNRPCFDCNRSKK